VAVHYQINGGEQLNFDIGSPDAESKTYGHVTPGEDGLPLCCPGASVSYWLSAEVDGLPVEQPEGAGADTDKRSSWIAHN